MKTKAGFQSPISLANGLRKISPWGFKSRLYLLVRWLQLQFPSFQPKLFQTKKQQKYFDNVTVIVNIVIDLSSSDEFSVATPDETTGKESEFSKDVVSLRNIHFIQIF